MAGVGNVVLTVGTATLINVAYDLQNKKPATVTLLAGAGVGAILIIVGSGTGSWEFVEAIGIAILVGSLFAHGAKVLGINTLLDSNKTSKAPSAAGPLVAHVSSDIQA